MSIIVCSFRLAFFILRSAVGETNLLLTKNLVVDLQESLSKDILSSSEYFSKGSVTFPLNIDPFAEFADLGRRTTRF